MPKIRNIIIFVVIAAIFILIYVFYIKSSSPTANLVSSPSANTLPNVNTGENTGGTDTNTANGTPFVAQDFLALLLNVKNIKLDDSIFSDPAFNSLHDSSIILTQDGTEGRPNPFAQFGNDATPAPINTSNTTGPTQSTQPIPPATQKGTNP